LALAALLLAGAASDLHAQRAAGSSEWSYFGGDRAYTRYAPLSQIDRTNVQNLEIVWRRPGVDASLTATYPNLNPGSYLRSTPIIVDGVMYAPNGVGLVEAFEPGTGRTLWVQRPFEETLQGTRGRSNRGVDVWGEGARRRIIVVREPYLYALDAATGEPIRDFGEGGRTLLSNAEDQAFRWSSGPIVTGDVIVVAGIIGSAGDSGEIKEAAPEDVRGFDARTGRHLWTFHVVPREGEMGNDTWGDRSWEWSGDLGSWCCMSADDETGLVYVPLSSPTAAYYGGHRPGWNLFANSLVALDSRTGERAWHFQMVHHDLWEYDTVGPPTLGDIVVDGRTIPAVMQPSKTGFLYVFDRRTGEPVWPIVERPVPQSTVPGEQTSATQPFPTKPPPFGAQGVTVDDLIDFTPELRARALELIEPYEIGPIFTPPSLVGANGKQGTLMRPGIWGSANWHTGAFDPETGYYYAVSHMLPDVFAITPTSTPEATMRYHGFEELDSRSPRIDGLPIFKPPYGRITAIDMNRGEHAWMVANGDGQRNHPLLAGLDVGPLGVPGRGAPLVTSTLLFIAEGSDAVIGTTEDMWGLGFRAYDKATGAVIWKTELDAGATAAPMTYMHEGTQYIVMAIGGNGREAEWIALALR
jgi:quinoprotein glucose dehydrogenase